MGGATLIHPRYPKVALNTKVFCFLLKSEWSQRSDLTEFLNALQLVSQLRSRAIQLLAVAKNDSVPGEEEKGKAEEETKGEAKQRAQESGATARRIDRCCWNTTGDSWLVVIQSWCLAASCWPVHSHVTSQGSFQLQECQLVHSSMGPREMSIPHLGAKSFEQSQVLVSAVRDNQNHSLITVDHYQPIITTINPLLITASRDHDVHSCTGRDLAGTPMGDVLTMVAQQRSPGVHGRTAILSTAAVLEAAALSLVGWPNWLSCGVWTRPKLKNRRQMRETMSLRVKRKMMRKRTLYCWAYHTKKDRDLKISRCRTPKRRFWSFDWKRDVIGFYSHFTVLSQDSQLYTWQGGAPSYPS